jgi:hypothetical protein
MWLTLYRSCLPPEAKITEVAYLSLGHTAKSGALNNYYCRQAMAQLDANERSFEFKAAFRAIVDVSTKSVRTVVFLDDFVGTGLQAVRTLTSYFDLYPWLADCNVYICALVGFRDGADEIKKQMSSRVRDVFVGQELTERDRAFSKQNPAWTSEDEREKAERWAADVGSRLLRNRDGYDSERDKLGWSNSQALVAFFYNVPNNTLPIFWAAEPDGHEWNSLLDRFD